MNKWLMLAVLVLMVLVSAFGLRNLAANQVATPIISSSTGNPVPVIKDPPPPTMSASTGNPVPVIKDGQLFASTGNPVPVIKDGQ